MIARKIVVAVTGASGSIYAQLLLQALSKLNPEEYRIGLVMSRNAMDVWEYELGNRDFEQLSFRRYAKDDFSAPFASGSAGFDTMIVIPCSMGTLGRIASGVSDDLLTRSADVMLKERRKLILVARETPLSLIHLKNMEQVTLAGGIICPAVPSFYHKPQTISDLAMSVVNRVLDLASLPADAFRWGQSE
jgi:4-hydroxy-3-polyprenylbenzoate decarboxylase